jgi:succinate dehydrogenase / fumarate reductase cytochrome b subunit
MGRGPFSFSQHFMYRPLSPHILIYKPQFSSVFSVFHRATGVVLSLGVFFLILLSDIVNNISFYPLYVFSFYINTYLSWLVIGAFIILMFSFCYHLSNGIRHLIWDFADQGEVILTKEKVKSTAIIVATSTIILLISLLILFY